MRMLQEKGKNTFRDTVAYQRCLVRSAGQYSIKNKREIHDTVSVLSLNTLEIENASANSAVLKYTGNRRCNANREISIPDGTDVKRYGKWHDVTLHGNWMVARGKCREIIKYHST